MKIALVHELLTMKGGAERVLRILADIFPEAPIYTLLYDEKKLSDWFPRERVRTSYIQSNFQFSIFNFQFNHHLYLSKFPAAVERWDFSEYDMILSTSSAFVHGIITNGKPKHISYINSPARYLWDRTHDVLEQAGKGPFGFLRRRYLEHIFHKLRVWDAEAADRPDKLLAASKEVQRRIELYWRRESDVVYPPIDDFWLDSRPHDSSSSPSLGAEGRPHEYFLIVSTLVPYKRIDLAIKACNKLNLPLKIAGTGPDKNRLEKIAGSSVEFLGYQTEEHLKELYSNATATIFPGEEDFGLVPLESMACGTPVIAHRSGGALETIIEGKTGSFFNEATPESLAQVLTSFDPHQFNSEDCKEQAKKFSRMKFEKKIRDAISIIK